MKTQLLSLHALTPMHAGTGQGVGIIDLPIAREKATGIPFLPGSSLKGALKPLVNIRNDQGQEDQAKKERRDAVFGKAGEDGTGAAQFADARLLCLPVRSLRGTFAYATSPYLLERLKADLELSEVNGAPAIAPVATQEIALASDALKVRANLVALEDLDLVPTQGHAAKQWADWLAPLLFEGADTRTRFQSQFCIVSNDVMSFLCRSGTQVTARIKLKADVKTVEKGQLWYEESLPAETVLISVITAAPLGIHHRLSADHVLRAALPRTVAQFGGKAGIGRGLCRLRAFAAPEATP